jgi:hypothetical protein
MSTITASDVATNYDDTSHLSDDGAVDAFMTSFKIDPETPDEIEEDAEARKRRKPSEEVEKKTDVTETEEEPAETDEETPPDEEGETEETDTVETAEKAKKFVEDADDTYVKVKMGDKELDVPIKDLKRLYGQEASLTQKSQEVAAQRKAADEGIAKNVAALNVLAEKAKAKAAPYAALDWVAIAKNPNISAEEASALRDEAKAAFDDVSFFEKDLNGLMTSIADKQKADTVAQAKVCISALSTAPTADKPNALYIEGWNDKVYDDLRSFARELGANPNDVNSMVDPVAFKILHMAMQFKRGSSKVLTVKTKKSPTKIVKTSSNSAESKAPSSTVDRKAAVAKLARSGSDEDAMDAFMASMADK